MIVKCDKCQTRFKIPDEKVTEKGVKVRCTRCQHTFRVTRSQDNTAPAPAAPAPPPAVHPDPFARFGSAQAPDPLEATRPGLFPEGIAATRLPDTPLAPSFGAQSDLPPEVFDQPTRIAPIPKDLLEDALPPQAFDPSHPFGDPSAAASRPPPAADATAASVAATLLGKLPDPAASSAVGLDEPAPTGKTGGDLLGAHPPADELIGRAGSPLISQEVPTPDVGDGAGPGRGTFGVPEAPPPPAKGEPEARAQAVTDSKDPAHDRPAASSASVKPAGRPEDVGMDEARRPGAVRRTAGLLANLAVASLLVWVLLSVGTIYLNEGKLDLSALSLEPLKAMFAAPGDLLAVDVSNGLYDTRGGKPVFYVRGEIENRGKKSSRAKVRVEILDGATSVTHSESLAGRAPNPEELFAVTNAQELSELGARLDQQAVEVKPGGRVPFLVAFYEYPPQLADYRLKVTVQEAAEAAVR